MRERAYLSRQHHLHLKSKAPSVSPISDLGRFSAAPGDSWESRLALGALALMLFAPGFDLPQSASCTTAALYFLRRRPFPPWDQWRRAISLNSAGAFCAVGDP